MFNSMILSQCYYKTSILIQCFCVGIITSSHSCKKEQWCKACSFENCIKQETSYFWSNQYDQKSVRIWPKNNYTYELL